MLDFSKLAEEEIVEVPVRNGRFIYHSKDYVVKSEEEGWFRVKIENNKAEIVEPVYDFENLEKTYKSVRGYTYHNTVVFHNFDSAKRNYEFDQIQMPLHFNNVSTFNAIKGIVWEDKQIYFILPDYSNFKIYDIKSSFDEDKSIEDVKGATPELRTLYLFHEIERDQFREMERQRLELERLELAAEERKRREEEMMRTVQGRLQINFQRAGATITNYSLKGNQIEVDWELSGGRKYNSVIDARTFKVVSAGYCMSGEDSKHNLTSMVKLAEDYEERGLTHITRHRG